MQDATHELAELARLTGMRRASSPPPDWSAVTAALGYDVPCDYRRLIETHGAGLFRDREITVITWGSTEDAVYCHWIAEPGTDPESWPTAFHTVTAGVSHLGRRRPARPCVLSR
ncbi:hypothetical protein [Streptodolium elevatio]